jgi:hypothetical protein
MKTIILVVSIVFLWGCTSPFDKGNGEKEPDCIDYYIATITVHYENGKPCTTAMGVIEEIPYGYDGVGAEDNGTLRLQMLQNCDENNPATIITHCRVYSDLVYDLEQPKTELEIWNGDIEMINVGDAETWKPNFVWPDPFIEIVIPDSLAP